MGHGVGTGRDMGSKVRTMTENIKISTYSSQTEKKRDHGLEDYHNVVKSN